MQLVPINPVNGEKELTEVEFFNKENPQAVYNIMPDRLRKVLDSRKGLKEYLSFEEWELRKEIKMSPTLNRLRYGFWNEYYRSLDQKRNMKIGNVYAGICSVEVFNRITMNDAQVAWIMTPPSDTVVSLKESLNYGLDRVREILDLPLMKIESVKVGKDEFEDREVVDEKVANLMLKAVAMIDLRLHGSYVQVSKIEQKTLNVNQNYNSNQGSIPAQAEVIENDDMDKKLIELRKQVTGDLKKLEAPITKDEVIVMEQNGINTREMTMIKGKTLDKAGALDIEDADVLDL